MVFFFVGSASIFYTHTHTHLPPPLSSADLAARLLASMPPKSKILIFNHENITNCWYKGDEKSMLIVNCLFRAGGAAILMSNDRRGAKYELVHAERTHFAAVDAAFKCMGDAEDAAGNKGVFLDRSLVSVATDAIRFNLTRLAPVVLPVGELAKAAKDKAYVPKFGKVREKGRGGRWVRGIVVVLGGSLQTRPLTKPFPPPPPRPPLSFRSSTTSSCTRAAPPSWAPSTPPWGSLPTSLRRRRRRSPASATLRPRPRGTPWRPWSRGWA